VSASAASRSYACGNASRPSALARRSVGRLVAGLDLVGRGERVEVAANRRSGHPQPLGQDGGGGRAVGQQGTDQPGAGAIREVGGWGVVSQLDLLDLVDLVGRDSRHSGRPRAGRRPLLHDFHNTIVC
jgi:hypothetical protein